MPSCINIHSVTEGESLFTSVVIIVPNLGDCGNLELNSLKKFDQETIEEFEYETANPNKVERWMIQFTTLELKK